MQTGLNRRAFIKNTGTAAAFLHGLATIGPVRTAIMSTIEPFWTALLGGLVLRQALGPRTLLGGVCIAAAVVLLQLGHGREATPEPI